MHTICVLMGEGALVDALKQVVSGDAGTGERAQVGAHIGMVRWCQLLGRGTQAANPLTEVVYSIKVEVRKMVFSWSNLPSQIQTIFQIQKTDGDGLL